MVGDKAFKMSGSGEVFKMSGGEEVIKMCLGDKAFKMYLDNTFSYCCTHSFSPY